MFCNHYRSFGVLKTVSSCTTVYHGIPHGIPFNPSIFNTAIVTRRAELIKKSFSLFLGDFCDTRFLLKARAENSLTNTYLIMGSDLKPYSKGEAIKSVKQFDNLSFIDNQLSHH